jgi:hypothetical protein
MKSDELSFINEYLTAQELYARKEEVDAQKKKEEVFDLISDNEEEEDQVDYDEDDDDNEDDEDDEIATSLSLKPTQLASESALGKRQRVESSVMIPSYNRSLPIQLDDEDEEGEIPLPENNTTQRRTSRRVPKRPITHKSKKIISFHRILVSNPI